MPNVTFESLTARPLLTVRPEQLPEPEDVRMFQEKSLRREREIVARIARNSRTEQQVRRRLAEEQFEAENADVTPLGRGFRISVWSRCDPKQAVRVP